ncbi:MAG: phage tail sheath C-terminal domain-containing protein [Clostridiales bacterium]
MAGGTWTIQNKIRPGAYVNFKSIPNPKNPTAAQGIATMPMVLHWGAEAQITEILSTDLADGTIKKKLGYDTKDAEMLTIRECLKNCYKLLVYRVNTTGVKATATLGALTATAKYTGVRGNALSLGILATTGSDLEVVTYLNGTEVDRQKTIQISALTSNDYLEFSGAGTLTATAAKTLTGGTDGTSPKGNYDAYLELLKAKEWQVLGMPVDDVDITKATVSAIKTMREDLGKKVQAVVYNYPGDYEGVISTKQGYVTTMGSVSAVDFVAYATGISAGAALPKPNTYHEITDAIAIINPMTDAEIKTNLEQGFMLISRCTDGAIVIEQDINTLITFTDTKSKAFCKNRFIRTVDEICNGISRTFEKSYIGKINNDITGRELFKQALIKYITALQDKAAIENFTADDIVVTRGAEADSVVVNLAIKPIDAMEKLYMTVEVS